MATCKGNGTSDLSPSYVPLRKLYEMAIADRNCTADEAQDAGEGTMAFAEKRPAVWVGY